MKEKIFFALGTTTQIYDNNRMVLSRCRRIIEYNDIYLKVDAVNLYIEIWGTGLSVDDYGEEGIEVYGKINSVEFSALPGRER